MKPMFANSFTRHAAAFLWIIMAAGLASCGGSSDSSPVVLPISPPAAPVAKNLACDDTMKSDFRPDDQTTVLLVRAFKKDDPLILSGAATAQTLKAANDLCLVKLLVGPGNPGPAGAPSTSVGIGIEVWLPTPTNWNSRVHAVGGGAWQGGAHTSLTDIASAAASGAVAGTEGAVSSQTDAGHTVQGGTFGMNPDGTINQTGWNDFSHRAVHEQAVKTKALATAYYGSAPKYSYWEGGSLGGTQGLSLAQRHPEDFDGIIANYPSINWTKFITAELYPQVIFQRELGGITPTLAQQDLVSNAAISACDSYGGKHLGFLIDPASCRYDPTTDPNVLCVASGGTNSTPACVTQSQAVAFNRIWYGMTSDGSAPSPATDNGWSLPLLGNQRWYGLSRGTSLYAAQFGGIGLTGLSGPFAISSDTVAMELQNSTIAGLNFKNASGDGASQWKALSYAQLSNAFDRGISLQPVFSNINNDNPDLSAFKNRGGKILTYHGLADELIMPQGSIQYYERVIAQMGGLANVQGFYRLYLAAGLGHQTLNGSANPAASVPADGLADMFTSRSTVMYKLITDWVEKGIVPDRVDLKSPPSSPVQKSLPMCVYPTRITYVSGDPYVAASYNCQ